MAGDELAAAVRDAEGARQSAARQQLIVVASLVGKAPNIAGLVRTAEVLR